MLAITSEQLAWLTVAVFIGLWLLNKWLDAIFNN